MHAGFSFLTITARHPGCLYVGGGDSKVTGALGRPCVKRILTGVQMRVQGELRFDASSVPVMPVNIPLQINGLV